MAEEQTAFDNWEEEAELQITKQQDPEPPKQQAKVENTPLDTKLQTKEVIPEPVDPQKQFNQKLATFRQINEDKFDAYFQGIKDKSTNDEIVISNQILKNDKDFAQFAKKVGRKLNDVLNQKQLQNLEDEHVYDFIEEIALLTYNQLEWKNIEATKDKLRIVKKEKKEEEIKAKKQKEKEERLKKLGKNAKQEEKGSPAKDKKEEDDIFGGATLVNSKQIEEEIKAKGVQKVEVKKVEEDDDDFM